MSLVVPLAFNRETMLILPEVRLLRNLASQLGGDTHFSKLKKKTVNDFGKRWLNSVQLDVDDDNWQAGNLASNLARIPGLET